LSLNLVLLGGIGFIGVNVARVAVNRGYKVKVVARKGSEKRRPRIYKELRRMNVEIVLLNELSTARLSDLNPDVYIYLIGKLSGSRRDLWEAHVHLLDRVIEAASRNGSRLVYFSAIAALGDVRGAREHEVIVEEERHLDPEVFRQRNDFERSKAEGERLLVKMGSKLKNKFAILRPGLVFGKWAYHLEWKALCMASRLGIYPRLYPVPLTPVSSLADLTLRASEGEYDGKWINAVSENSDIEVIARRFCEELSLFKRCAGFNVGFMLDLIPSFAGGALRVFKDLMRRKYIYASKILKDFTWRSVDDEVNEMVRWIKEVRGVKA
jgi:nucleoside-diphosphate-sugar epimerase